MDYCHPSVFCVSVLNRNLFVVLPPCRWIFNIHVVMKGEKQQAAGGHFSWEARSGLIKHLIIFLLVLLNI